MRDAHARLALFEARDGLTEVLRGEAGDEEKRGKVRRRKGETRQMTLSTAESGEKRGTFRVHKR